MFTVTHKVQIIKNCFLCEIVLSVMSTCKEATETILCLKKTF